MFFEIIYRWFEQLFGGKLADYLAGYDCSSESFIGSNQFVSIGILAIAIAIAFVVLYYYVINHPRFNRWWSWLIMLVVTGLANLFIGYGIVSSDVEAGNAGDCFYHIEIVVVDTISVDSEFYDDNEHEGMRFNLDSDGNKVYYDVIKIPLINQIDYWGFGLANFFVSAIWFILFSFAFKWRSRNCKYSPF